MRKLFVLAVASALLVGVGCGLVLHRSLGAGRAAARPLAPPSLRGEATWAAGARHAPGFMLRDQRGSRVSLASLRGRAVALLFMDSLCKGACPLEGRAIAAVVRRLPTRMRPRVVVVSVDPAGDTPRTVAAAARKWRLPAGFEWLLGTRRELRRVWRAYDITVAASAGDILHSTAIYLIDARGDERAGFLMPFEPAFVTGDLRLLAREQRSAL